MEPENTKTELYLKVREEVREMLKDAEEYYGAAELEYEAAHKLRQDFLRRARKNFRISISILIINLVLLTIVVAVAFTH